MPIIVDYSTGIPSVPLDDLTDRVRSEVRLCPYDLIYQKAIDLIREFCRYTRAWQYYPANKLTVIGQNTYDITVPMPDAECIQVEWMRIDGGPCYPKTVRELDGYRTDWRNASGDDFSIFTQELSRQFTLAAKPLTADKVIEYRISMQPALDAARIGEDLLNEWEDTFVEGIKAKLFALSQRPWTDLDNSKLCGQRFYVGKQKARVQAWRQYAVNVESFVAKFPFAGR